MNSTKRTADAPTKRSRKHKKPRKGGISELTPEPEILGSTSIHSRVNQAKQKDAEELELEEAVFGRRTEVEEVEDDSFGLFKGKGKLREIDSQDEEWNGVEEDDMEETGLERLKDDNVRSIFT